ncbi:protein FAM151B isoform X2 [Apis laboriosa]|nr:protein FAM151B isoform X2 [Apis laboriosa]
MCASVTESVANFFPEIKGNLTKITWAHAVNDKATLNKSLEGNVMMLEADVMFGKVTGQDSTVQQPIMAHPPANESDLSLENFLNTVIERKEIKKGIKLDFKSVEAFNASKPILDKVRDSLTFPVFLNADILEGPTNATAIPVDAKFFIGQAKTYPKYTLSVGWTTSYANSENNTENIDRYTEQQIQRMINTLKEQHVTQPVTYPVRAGLAANDIKAMKMLMENSTESGIKNATLTVWSGEGDKVNAEKLSQLIKEIGVENVYVDVPKELMDKLRLSAASNPRPATLVLAATLFLAVSLSTML